MKLFYFFLLFFTNGVNPTKGQLHLEFSGEMLLRFVFHPNYDFYTKYCCKFSRYGCIVFVNSNGHVHSAYKGRIETYTYSGIFDVRIWNVRSSDAGRYRCEIHAPQNSVYQDFQVVIADIETAMNPILAIPKSTIPPVSSVQLLEIHEETSSNGKWSLKFALGTIFGIVVITLIIAITLAVICYKKKSRDRCVRSVRSAPSVTELPQELIYTTVDFKLHQKTCNIYANLDIHNSRPDSGKTLPKKDTVEYATIAGVL